MRTARPPHAGGVTVTLHPPTDSGLERVPNARRHRRARRCLTSSRAGSARPSSRQAGRRGSSTDRELPFFSGHAATLAVRPHPSARARTPGTKRMFRKRMSQSVDRSRAVCAFPVAVPVRAVGVACAGWGPSALTRPLLERAEPERTRETAVPSDAGPDARGRQAPLDALAEALGLGIDVEDLCIQFEALDGACVAAVDVFDHRAERTFDPYRSLDRQRTR